MVFDLIRRDKMSIIIDDIEGKVIIKETNPINEILEKSIRIMKNNLNDLIKYSLNKNIKHRLTSKGLVGKDIEKINYKESEMDIDYNNAAAMMAMNQMG